MLTSQHTKNNRFRVMVQFFLEIVEHLMEQLQLQLVAGEQQLAIEEDAHGLVGGEVGGEAGVF